MSSSPLDQGSFFSLPGNCSVLCSWFLYISAFSTVISKLDYPSLQMLAPFLPLWEETEWKQLCDECWMYFWELCAAYLKSGFSLYKNAKKKKSKPSVKLPFFFFLQFLSTLAVKPSASLFTPCLYIILVNDVSKSNFSHLFLILPKLTQSSCDWSRVTQFVRAEVTVGWIMGLSFHNLLWHFKHICKQRTFHWNFIML